MGDMSSVGPSGVGVGIGGFGLGLARSSSGGATFGNQPLVVRDSSQESGDGAGIREARGWESDGGRAR